MSTTAQPRARDASKDSIDRKKEGSKKESSNEPATIGNYRIERTIGQGTYGKVKLGIHLQTEDKVAIKVIEKSNIQSAKQVARIQREIRFLKLLHHPHIVKVYEVYETPEQIFIVMEYVKGGELFDYIVTHKRVKEKEARMFYRMVLSAVDYCHKNAVIHRDLKPENLLLDENKTIKIIDFGFGNTFKPQGLLDTFCGSPFYAAPEMILGKKYEGPEVDMWSLGVILFALLCGHLPFDDENIKELYKKISSGTYTVPSYLSPDARHLIQRLITVDPKKRATLDEVMNHPWVNEGYNGPPANYLPVRPTITDPSLLSKDIINRLNAFTYTAEDIASAFSETDQSKAHPIRATYFLLQEMLTREEKRLKEAGRRPSQPPSPSIKVFESQPVQPAKEPPKNAPAPKIVEPPQNGSNPALNTGSNNNLAVAPNNVACSLYSISEDEPDSQEPKRGPATTPITASGKNNFISMPHVVPNSQNRRSSTPEYQLPNGHQPKQRPTPSLTLPNQSTHSQNIPSGPSSAPPTTNRTPSDESTAETAASNEDPVTNGETKSQSSTKPASDSRTRRFSLSSITTITSSKESRSRRSSASSTHSKHELRQVSGWFLNVSTTSSKLPSDIITEVCRVLKENEVSYMYDGGYVIECTANEGKGNEDSTKGSVVFEIEICKVPRLNLFGLHFKRLNGSIWNYKKVCNKLLAQMNL